ncbi:MAG: hypothetical protein KAU24_02730 [Candidatus Aenigmarchaeota archaeon]|nr:hypothetical protein [Candidatus Aenigmarchaeota archaeon]
MGKKKECSCGYWNKEQEECLYNGFGCAKDERKLNKGWIEKKIENLATLFCRFIEIGRENDKVSDDYINTKAKEVVRSLVD